MKRKATSVFVRWCVLLLSCMTLSSGVAMAQSSLMFSKDANFSTEDREFDETDTIFMRVEATDVDFSSVRFSKFRLIPRTEEAEYEGEFINNFDGTYDAEFSIADLDLVDHLWTWEGLIEDAAGNSFETKVLLRIGDPNVFSGFEVRAVVESVNTDFFVLKGYEFHVDDQTVFEFPPYRFDPNADPNVDPGFIPSPDDGPQPATFQDVLEGYLVRVKVEPSETGELVARRVEINGPPFTPGEVNMTGRVESIDQSSRSIQVRGRQVFVNEFTQLGNSQETVGDAEIPEWIVGRRITIYGEFQDDDTILAHFVHVAEGVREELEVRGIVEAVSDTEVTVQGFDFEITAATVFEKDEPLPDGKGEDSTAVGKATLSEIDAGLIVRVYGVVNADGVQLAERIRIESGVDNGVRISGAVEGVSEDGFSIRGWHVQIADYTQLFNTNFEPVPFEELIDGQLVLVFGEFLDDGSIQAHHVEYRRKERDEFNLYGPITEVGVDFIKVWDVPFGVTETSIFENGFGEPLTFADMNVGLLVEAIGLPDAMGALSIERVFVPQGAGEFVRLNGHLANPLPESFEVLGKTVVISPETHFRDLNFQPLEYADFEDGAAVQVFGNFTAEGTVQAHEVVMSIEDREEVEVWGPIQAANGDIITVGGIDLYVDAETKVFHDSPEGGEEGSPADLTVGTFVGVLGVYDEQGTPFIDWVQVPQKEDDNVRISGTVSGASASGMVLWGQEIMFTEFTQFFGETYEPISPEELVDGLSVDVFGRYDEFGVILADAVEVRGSNKEELSITGAIDLFDGQIVVLGGTTFLITDATQIFDNTSEGGITPDTPDGGGKYSGVKLSGTAGKFAGALAGIENLEAGLQVEVFGVLNADGAYEATVIHIHDEGNQVGIGGAIEVVDAGGLMVLGRTVHIGFETFIQDDNFEPVAPETLIEGQYVEVRGEMLEDGSIQAFNITVRPGEEEFMDFWGTIESVQGDVVFVHDTPFVVSEFTFINSDTEMPLTAADLAAGMEINIKGQRGEDGVVTATDIFVPGNAYWAWMNGEIRAIDGETLDVQGRNIVAGPETFIFDETYTQVTVADLQVGQRVFVAGEILEDGSLNAFNIDVQGSEFNELQIFGSISAIEGDLVTVNGRSYVYTAETHITSDDGTDVLFEELQAGQFVNIVVIPDGQGGTKLARIFVESQGAYVSVRMRGAIQELAPDGLVIQGQFFLLAEETWITGPNYEPIPLEALVVGQVVNVYGAIEEGALVAHSIESQQGKFEEIEFRGAISEVAGDLFIIRGMEFVVDSSSVVQDDKGFPVDVAVLAPGTIVNVIGTPTEAGPFHVLWMHVGAGGGDNFINVSGQVARLDPVGRTFSVQGLLVKVEEFVEVVGPNFEFIPFAELEDGMSLRVFGQYEAPGAIRAHRIEVRSGQGEELEFRGRIEMISDEEIVVRGLPFTITPNTWINDGQGLQIAVADLKPGQIVSVTGVPGEDGRHAAINIFVTTGNEDRSMRISGRIVELDGPNRVLVVRDHVIEISPEAEIVGDTYERIAFDALAVGRQVSVWGWLHEDGKIEGFRVELRLPNKEDFQVVGVLSDIEGRVVSVNGLEILVAEEAFVGAPEIGRLPFENLFPGLVVSIQGATGPAGGLLGAKVQVFGLDESEAIEFNGSISNLGSNQFEIGSIGMSFDDQTFLLNGNNQPILPAALQDGFNVNATAFGEGSDLSVRAMRVFDIIQDERSVLGRVENITASTFSVREYTFTVTEETVFLDPFGDPMEFADVVDRMRVDVHALADGTGALVAREVQAKPRDRKLTGTVADIQGDYLVVAGLTIGIDPTTEFKDSEEEDVDPSSIVPGLTVNLTFNLGPGGTPLASKIQLLPRIEDEVVLNGTVEAVVEDLIVVMGRRFQVIPNTSMVDESGNTVDLQGYAVGDAVRIRALLLAGDNLVALRISKLDAESADIRVEGPIVSVSASTVEVMGIFFFINETTQFYDINRELVTVDAFAEGQTVFVIGEGQANGTVIATRVQVQNVSLTSGESTGISDAGEFSMFGNDYRVDDNTMVLGENNVQLGLEDVEAGQFLEVRGVADAEGGVAGKNNGSAILVSKIKIIDAEGSGEYEHEVDPEDNGEGGTATEGEELPEDYALFQNYPNPFNPITTIRFSLPTSSVVTLKVYDVTGREIQTLVSGAMVGGTHEVRWNGRSNAGTPVASGVYLYRMEAGNQIITRRMVLLK